MNKIRQQSGFEAIIFAITISPFAYLIWSWDTSVARSYGSIFAYFITSTLFYFFSVWFSQLDQRKENYPELLPGIRQIRLIWAVFMAGVGFVLFIHSIKEHDFNFMRITGGLLSLFLFASGNFQTRIHPSSAFSGNSWETANAAFRKNQRNYAHLKFWTGIIGTFIFLFLPNNQLFIGFFFIAVSIVYGIIFRIINGFLTK